MGCIVKKKMGVQGEKVACNIRFDNQWLRCPNHGKTPFMRQTLHVMYLSYSNDAYEEIKHVSND